jgi:hypothetical protein
MTLKTQTSRRGMIVTSAAAVAAVLVAVGAAAMMQDDDKSTGGSTVEQSAPQSQNGAPATATPTFLATADLPASAEAKTWTEQPGTSSGLPEVEYTCIKGLLAADSTTYKAWSGDMTAEMKQFVTVYSDAAAAEAAVAALNSGIASCDERVEGDSAYQRAGDFPAVANGVTVHEMYFAPENSEYHLQLFGVGRDGSTVVVTTLGQMGQKEDAPVDAFTTTAKTAVEKVY